jgi:metallophosphoesterase (TIGR00282 family)
MKILFFGDIIGKIGRKALKKTLPDLKKEYEVDLVIANAENIAHGFGVTSKTLNEMIECGVDVFTSGNHIWDKDEAVDIFKAKKINLIRPANYPPGTPGVGYKIIEISTKRLLVVNLIGRVFLRENFDCPFRKLDSILEENKNERLNGIIVDFHAEATSEKVALGYYADGRISAVVGTHTHVPTADERILPKGTAHISDVGMVGAKNSIIGDKTEDIIKRFIYQMPYPFEPIEEGTCQINAVLIEIDSKTGKAIKIERIDREVEI